MLQPFEVYVQIVKYFTCDSGDHIFFQIYSTYLKSLKSYKSVFRKKKYTHIEQNSQIE